MSDGLRSNMKWRALWAGVQFCCNTRCLRTRGVVHTADSVKSRPASSCNNFTCPKSGVRQDSSSINEENAQVCPRCGS